MTAFPRSRNLRPIPRGLIRSFAGRLSGATIILSYFFFLFHLSLVVPLGLGSLISTNLGLGPSGSRFRMGWTSERRDETSLLCVDHHRKGGSGGSYGRQHNRERNGRDRVQRVRHAEKIDVDELFR